MTEADVASLSNIVLWAAFAVAVAFGAIVQRTGFCTMGAVADAATMGDYTRMRQWALASATACAGFALLAGLGWISPEQTLYASTRWLWLSALAGGAIFGFGMVLASGCASKTLVRIGGGNLKSVVVALVVGITGFATLKGLTAVWRAASVDRVAIDFAGNASLGAIAARISGAAPATVSLALGLAVAAALAAWAFSSRDFRRTHNVAAGLGVGLAVAAMWWITGRLGHVAEHPATLQEAFLATNSTRAEGLSFVAPTAYALDWLMFFSDANKRLTVGIVTVAGVIAGSAAVSLAQKSFRWEGFGGPADLGHHLVGAMLMGVGGVTALGCTVGQGISGFSTLSLTSFTALAAMIAGAWGGVRYQAWRLDA